MPCDNHQVRPDQLGVLGDGRYRITSQCYCAQSQSFCVDGFNEGGQSRIDTASVQRFTRYLSVCSATPHMCDVEIRIVPTGKLHSLHQGVLSAR
jgi:hypothetical protein